MAKKGFLLNFLCNALVYVVIKGIFIHQLCVEKDMKLTVEWSIQCANVELDFRACQNGQLT